MPLLGYLLFSLCDLRQMSALQGVLERKTDVAPEVCHERDLHAPLRPRALAFRRVLDRKGDRGSKHATIGHLRATAAKRRAMNLFTLTPRELAKTWSF